MEDTKKLDEALSLARNEDYEKALGICDSYIRRNPTSPNGFRTRSQIYARKADFTNAIGDITEAIQRSEPEPKDYFFRGWWNLENENLSASIDDLSMAIIVGERLDSHYFDESAFFLRSVAFLRSSRFKEALADCNRVSDDFLIYLRSGQVSKAQILQEAKSKAE